MSKDLSQDWINWILENVLKGCDKNELLEILLKEGFDSTQCRIALGLELKIDDINEKGIIKKKPNYNIKNISAKRIEDLPLEIYEVEDFLSEDEATELIRSIVMGWFFERHFRQEEIPGSADSILAIFEHLLNTR